VTNPATPGDDDAAGPSRPGGRGGPRRRNSAETRRLLLEAASRRFVLQGYERTTVREIAADAGVNPALIKRYFESKEGLFEACLASRHDLLLEPAEAPGDRGRLVDTMARQLGGEFWPDTSEHPLLLFLRDSGDPRTDALRRRAVEEYTEGVLRATGHGATGEPDPDTVLRAQLLVALAAGVAVLRAAIGLEPLRGATVDQLTAPLTDVVTALLREPPAG
jgi:AcrR family transcriptional regulator